MTIPRFIFVLLLGGGLAFGQEGGDAKPEEKKPEEAKPRRIQLGAAPPDVDASAN